MYVAAFSGAAAASALDQQNGAVGTGTSLATGSVTPSEDNELVVSGVSIADGSSGTYAVDSGLTITDQILASAGNFEGGGLAYIIQTSAGAVNPTWSWTGSVNSAAVIATFKAAAAGGRTTKNTRSAPLGVNIGMNWRSGP